MMTAYLKPATIHKERFVDMGNIISAVAIAVISVVFFVNSFGFSIVNNTVTAGWWPRIISVLLFITSGMAAVEAIRQYRRELAKKESKEQRKARIEAAPGYFPGGTKRLLGTCVLFGFYMTIGLNTLAFVLSTLIFVPALTIWLGNKKFWQAALTGIFTAAACTAIFCIVMRMPMPRGTGIFRSFSLLFY